MRYHLPKDPKIVSLIHKVRTHPVLYDHRLPGHMDETLKEETWKYIAAACNMSSVEATMCWKNLYSCFMGFYRNELIRLVRANYSENETGPLPREFTPLKEEFLMNRTWGYYSDMGFIAPFRIRGADPELDRLIELAMPLVCKEVNKSTSATDSMNTNTNQSSEGVTLKSETNSSVPLLGMDVPDIETDNLTPDDLCLRSFFDSLYRSTRALPKHLQRRVKAEMLQSLNFAEVENDETVIVG